MEYLKNKRLYLSGPIEHDSVDANWRTEPVKVLSEQFGIDVFDPFDDPKQKWTPMLVEARKNKDIEEMERICSMFVRKDLCMVDRADFIVAYLPKGVPTFGTTHEIISANNQKKPVILVCPDGWEYNPAWFFGFKKIIKLSDWSNLYAYLQEVDDGKHKDNDRWAYTYGLI